MWQVIDYLQFVAGLQRRHIQILPDVRRPGALCVFETLRDRSTAEVVLLRPPHDLASRRPAAARRYADAVLAALARAPRTTWYFRVESALTPAPHFSGLPV